MNILVVGGGGREHAICLALKSSPRVTKLYCAPGNGGISQIAECLPIMAVDVEGVTRFALENAIDYVVVASDDPLAAGMTDVLEDAGLRVFGPRRNAAEIESSKVFAKRLMKKYGIPTARYETFSLPEEAIAYIGRTGAPIVVKADGLALGKGAVVAETEDDARAAVRMMMEDMKFGDSGARVVIEEYMEGRELTILAFTDGKTVVPMLSSHDHKRVFDGDRGPNTGGMGAVCPSPRSSPELERLCMDTIFVPTVEALRAEGRVFKGVLYFELMLTPSGPKVIEYNARFGDPEAQAVLPLLETDLLDIMESVTDERLAEVDIRWKPGASCVVVMASGGYPVEYEKGKKIEGLDSLPPGIAVYHAGTKYKDGAFYTNGGRVLGVTATDITLGGAIENAYAGVRGIAWDGAHYRTDIGRI
ncbi:MAG: phosphoribosylamine--glycine ligase [Oscillospiraceae bacterium]|jgi:phosphoribosylamine--glycine ligase|nr:phosphoribosylamine--glycine ligase [Oscillospiraceae bacterium]